MGFLLSGQVAMPDGAALIRPTGGETGFVGPDKVFTPPSGRGFTASIEIGFRGCRRLYPYYLCTEFLLSEGNVSVDISNFVTTNTKRCAIRFYRE